MIDQRVSSVPSGLTTRLYTPVLFLVFNRLELTQRVFEAIRRAQPSRLYLASDGGRERGSYGGEEDEWTKVNGVREYLISSIDWPCEVKTRFLEKNQGCRIAVSGAIDWFFQNEEMGIILEDDCCPEPSFFPFCEDLLIKYKHEPRVWHIAGNNGQFGWKNDDALSYYFSYYGSVWGWATWADRWQAYDVELKDYTEEKARAFLKDCFGQTKEVDFRIKSFESVKRGYDTWDYQWAYARYEHRGLSIVSTKNLICNLGFGPEATHTHDANDARSRASLGEVCFPLVHPERLERDRVSDDRFFRRLMKIRWNRRLRRAFSRVSFGMFGR